MQPDLDKYYIQYICDLLGAYPPEKVEAAQQLIIISTLDAGSIYNQFLSNLTDNERPRNLQQTAKEGIPSFFQTKNKIIANFGKYFIRDPAQLLTSRQSMLNILYTFKLAKKLKIVIAFDQQTLFNNQKAVLDVFRHLSTTFTNLIVQYEQNLNKNIISDVSNCTSLMVMNQGKDQPRPFDLVIKLLTSMLSKDKNMKKDSEIGYYTLEKIIKNKQIIFQSEQYHQILDKLAKVKSFKFSLQTLRVYFNYNIKANRTQIQKKRKQAVLKGVSNFINAIQLAGDNIHDKLYKILSLDKDQRFNTIELIQSKIIYISAHNFLISQRISGESQIMIMLAHICSDFSKLLQINSSSVSLQKICMPWEIIQAIFKWKIILGDKKNLFQSRVYCLGYIAKMCFKVFSYLSELEKINQRYIERMPQYFVKSIQIFSSSFSQRVQDIRIGAISPRTILKMIEKIEQLVKILDNLLHSLQPRIVAIRPEMMNAKKFIQIDLLMLREIYLNRMMKHLNNNEKIIQVVDIYKSYLKNKDQIMSIYEKKSYQLLKVIYEILGDQLVKYQMYAYAIDVYKNGGLFYKLINVCKESLEEFMNQLPTKDFLKRVQIFNELGYAQMVRRYCYQYLEQLPTNQKTEIHQYLIDTAENELRVQKHNFMGMVAKEVYSNKVILFEEEAFDTIVTALKEKMHAKNSNLYLLE